MHQRHTQLISDTGKTSLDEASMVIIRAFWYQLSHGLSPGSLSVKRVTPSWAAYVGHAGLSPSDVSKPVDKLLDKPRILRPA